MLAAAFFYLCTLASVTPTDGLQDKLSTYKAGATFLASERRHPRGSNRRHHHRHRHHHKRHEPEREDFHQQHEFSQRKGYHHGHSKHKVMYEKPVTPKPGGYVIDPRITAETIRDLQAFIAAQPEGWASLMLMGDSTMAGLSSALLDLTPEVTDSAWLVHIVNDRPRAVNFGNKVSRDGEWHRARGVDQWVMPREQWADPEALDDPVARGAVERMRAATSTIYSGRCSWGGGVETFVYKVGPLKGLVVHQWSYLPEYSEVCWSSKCYRQAAQLVKPTAIVWNVGLHILNHDFDEATCKKREIPALWNCGDHGAMVREGMHDFLGASEHVVWKTTNWLCQEKQVQHQPELNKLLLKWQDERTRPLLEEKCRTDCPDVGQMGECYDWIADSHTSRRLYAESMEVLDELWHSEHTAKVHLLDAYKATKACCGKGCDLETDDGEHYFGLDHLLLHNLSAILSRSGSV